VTQRRPGREFAGSWRIAWTEVWANDALDLVGPAYIQFAQDGFGEFGMIAVRGWLDCRYGTREGRPAVEFSWDGKEEGDDVRGRGWAVLEEDGSLRGWLFFHCGEESKFRAVSLGPKPRSSRVSGRRRS
jgi:hypothetical protein